MWTNEYHTNSIVVLVSILIYISEQPVQCSVWRSIISSLLVCLFSDSSKVKCQMSNVNKVELLSERTSGVPPVIFFLHSSSPQCSVWVYGEASSALCLFVCSAIRGQETIQRCEGSDDHLIFLSLATFSLFSFLYHVNLVFQIFVCFPFCFAMKPHCVALSGKQVWPENENIYKLSALVDKYCESMHTNLLPFSNKYYMNMCVSFGQFWPQGENIDLLPTLG